MPMASILVCLVIGWWVTTGGTGHPFKPYDQVLATFYDVQGQSMLSGRLDVPCSVIRQEAYIVGDRCYGYFGVTPSLFRLPFNALFPAYRGHWAALSIIAGYALLLLSAYGLSLIIRRHVLQVSPVGGLFSWVTAIFLLALGLGSTSVFLLSRPVVHQEAIMWSSALALCSLVFMLRHVFLGDGWALLIATVLALLAIHARPLAGLTAASFCAIGAAARVLLIERSDRKESVVARLSMLLRSPLAVSGIVAGGLVVASYSAMNYAKFGAIEGMPLRYYVSSSPQLEERLKGSLFHVANIRWNLSNQFGMEGLKATDHPPFVKVQFRMQGEIPRDREQLRYPEAHIGGIEPYISIPVGMTGLLLFSVVGVVGALRSSRRLILVLLCLAALIGPIATLMFAYVSYRYLHEYAIFFALAGAIAVCHLGERSARSGRISAILLAIIVAGNVLLNIGFLIRYQTSETNLGPPIQEMKDAVERLRGLRGYGP